MNLKSELLQKYPFKLEMHLHAKPVSRCAKITPKEVVELYHSYGFDGLTLTNHIDPCALSYSEDDWVEHYMKGYYELSECAKKYGMMVYLAAEVRFTENANDYLVYGVDEEVIRNIHRHLDKGIEKFYSSIDKEKTIVLQAHPFRDNMKRNYTEHLDGIEVLNMAEHNSRPAMAAMFAKEHHGIKVGGCDLHYPKNIPCMATCFKTAPKDGLELAKLLEEGDYIFELGDMVILP